jgi:hypothetical protein
VRGIVKKTAVAIVLFLALQVHALKPLQFDAPPNYVHGWLLTVADFDGDGHVETITRIDGEMAVSANRGLADGTFVRGPLVNTGDTPLAAEAADFDGDGRLDLAIGGVGSIQLLRGRGDATYDAPIRLGSVDHAIGLAAADVDGDHHLDLIVSTWSESIEIYWGKGDGTFAAPLFVDVPEIAYDVKAADLDGDGRADIVAGFEVPGLLVFQSVAGRQFGGAILLRARAGTYGFEMHDLNADGKLDIAFADPFAFLFSTFLGNGDGSFGERHDFAGGGYTEGVAFGDMSGDGIEDAVLGNSVDGTLVVLPGHGDGTFDAPRGHVAGYNVYDIRVFDVNGDGRDDVITFDIASYSVLLQVQPGRFAQLRSQVRLGSANDLVTADFNRDGIADLAAPTDGSVIAIMLGKGDGTFLGPHYERTGRIPSSIAAADLNGDAIPDLASANFFSKDVSVLLGRGDGTFLDAVFYETGTDTSGVSLGDIDRDGDADMLVTVARAAKVSVFLNDGHGGFTPGIDLTAREAWRVLLVDVNHDQKIDAVVADHQSPSGDGRGSLTIHLGNGDGTFATPRDLSVEGDPMDLDVADLDEDGDLDLVVPHLDRYVSILRNDGAGNFTLRELIPVFGAIATVLADFNHDGHVDIGGANPGFIFFYTGRGDGSFGEPVRYRAGLNPWTIAAADFDRDGKTDVAVSNILTEDVTVLLNDTRASRTRAVRH